MASDEDVDPVLLRSLQKTTWRFYTLCVGLGAVVALGVYAYIVQLQSGLAVTGLNDRVSWGLYISNFVFFIGISHAGTLISAILRLCNAEWRRPITRAAEAITVLVLFFGLGSIIMDLGRPDRLFYVLQY
ncbi:MAG: NrfD/PsrC family molybdoenzyme membrane anchor subunit, partial [Burkholderiales bacterium]